MLVSRALSSVVLPLDVAPATTKETPYRRHMQRKSIIFCVAFPPQISCSRLTREGCSNRMETEIPLSSSTMGSFSAVIRVFPGK